MVLERTIKDNSYIYMSIAAVYIHVCISFIGNAWSDDPRPEVDTFNWLLTKRRGIFSLAFVHGLRSQELCENTKTLYSRLHIFWQTSTISSFSYASFPLLNERTELFICDLYVTAGFRLALYITSEVSRFFLNLWHHCTWAKYSYLFGMRCFLTC